MNNNYTTLVICEGEKTEPLFFTSIKDYILEQKTDESPLNIQLTVAPEPQIEEEENDSNKPVKHKANRKLRTSKPVESIDTIEIVNGPPPLRWVQTALRELETGAYNEVWTVFDNDNHPKHKEAFEAAKETVNGTKVQIAFSSRSFEQYLLTHFERSNTRFQKTDCKHKKGENTYSNQCGTNLYPDIDCTGNICINGYAASKGYWSNSKTDNSKNYNTFLLIKDKLEIGFENSSWLRYKSKSSTTPIYEKNPYTDVDILVKKLIQNELLHEWIDHDKTHTFDGIEIIYDSNNCIFQMKNSSKTTKIIEGNILTVFSDSDSIVLGKRCILSPEEQTGINLTRHIFSANYFKVKLNQQILLFEKKPNTVYSQ